MSQGTEYLIVTTSYPTKKNICLGTGCSPADVVSLSERVASDESYLSYEGAVAAARLIRNSEVKFKRPGGVDEEDDPDEFWGEDPPWDSADANDWEYRTAIRLEVMTRAEYEKKCLEEERCVVRERRKSIFQRKVRRSVLASQVAAAGRVHYSKPPQPYDIPAEMEIDEDEALKNIIAGTEEVAVPQNASSIKTLKYVGLKRWKTHMESAMNLSNYEVGFSDLLLNILRRSTALEELYLEMKVFVGYELPPEYIEHILYVAPHLTRSLKVLSISNFFVGPECLYLLSKFKGLERLDLSDTFHTEHTDSERSESFDSYEDLSRPYDMPLLNCVESLPNIKRIDLGHGKEHMIQYFFDYAMTRQGMVEAQELMDKKTNGEGQITMDVERMPMKWSNKDQEEVAVFQTIWGMIENEEEDSETRELAFDVVHKCPTCFQNGKQYCSRCMKQWYCSRKCQKLHWQHHKLVCHKENTC